MAVAAGHSMQVKERHYEKVGEDFEQGVQMRIPIFPKKRKNFIDWLLLRLWLSFCLFLCHTICLLTSKSQNNIQILLYINLPNNFSIKCKIFFSTRHLKPLPLPGLAQPMPYPSPQKLSFPHGIIIY